jgi:sugar/nucleoside kinase (ribokinase family)
MTETRSYRNRAFQSIAVIRFRAMRKPTRKSSEIVVLGDINADIIGRVKSWPRPGQECLAERLELHCGGVGANCALALRRWGISVGLIGCVGEDELGGFLLKTLAAGGVNVRCVRRTASAMTGMLYINVTPDGQRTFFGSRGANQWVGRLGPDRSSLLERARAASLMGYSFLKAGSEAVARQVIAAVHRNNGWVSLDAGMEPSKKIPKKILRAAKSVDLFFVSDEEAMLLTGFRNPKKAFACLLELGIPDVVMKLGKRGCLTVDGGTVRQVPSFSMRAVDTTGAGDAFSAGFLGARLRRWPAIEAALLANAAGAAAAGVVGAGERLPSQQQIVRMLSAARLGKPWDEVRLRVLRRLRAEPPAGRGRGPRARETHLR